MNELFDLVDISSYAGERFDLTQAGGGNSSVKLDDGRMFIKASGFSLSEVKKDGGYSVVMNSHVSDIVKNKSILNEKDKFKRELLAKNIIKDATIDDKNRPSIETLLHSLLYKYTLHTHPIVVNMLTTNKNWYNILRSIFGDQIGLVPYKTPGVDLAIELSKVLAEFDSIPNIIFLQNHGLIISSDEKSDIIDKTELVLSKIENYLKIDFSRYKTTNKISNLYRQICDNNVISYLSDDGYLNKTLISNRKLFFYTPFCPDSLVYCGISCCEINDLSDLESMNSYNDKYSQLPKVIICTNNIFFISQNIKKAREMEEVLKFNIMVLNCGNVSDKNFLENDELFYLNNWEAEKYRQKL